MKRIEGLKRAVNEARVSEAGTAYDYRKKTRWAYQGRNASDAPYNQLKDGIPTPIMDYILHNEWKFLDAEMTDIVDFAVTLPRNLVSEFRLKGNIVYIAVLLSDFMSRESDFGTSTQEDVVWRIGISMRKTGDRVGRPGKYTYEFSREDSSKLKNIGYLFYRAEREVNSVVDSGRDKKTYLIDPRESTMVRRGNYWGGESRKRSSVRGRGMSEESPAYLIKKYAPVLEYLLSMRTEWTIDETPSARAPKNSFYTFVVDVPDYIASEINLSTRSKIEIRVNTSGYDIRGMDISIPVSVTDYYHEDVVISFNASSGGGKLVFRNLRRASYRDVVTTFLVKAYACLSMIDTKTFGNNERA